MPPLPVVTLYTREGCHLCDRAAEVIDRVRRGGKGFDLRLIDVDVDPALVLRYGNDVPVILVDGVEAARHRIDESILERALEGKSSNEEDAGSDLARMSCVPCRGGVPPLERAAIEPLLRRLGGTWRVEGYHHLETEYRFPDFRKALEFTNRIGEIAEAEGHHPDLELSWGRVGVRIYTHKIDGLTESDFVLAAKIDEACC